MTEQSIFAERLRTLRKKHGMTQEELGNKIGVRKSTVSNYEAGYNTPTADTICEIGRLFDVSVDYLLGFSNLRTRFDQYADVARMFVYKPDEITAMQEGDSGKEGQFIDLPYDTAILHGKEYLALRAGEHADALRGISRSDYLLVRKCEQITPQQLGVITARDRTVVGHISFAGGFAAVAGHSRDSATQPLRFDVTRDGVHVIGRVVKIISGVN